MFGNPTEKPEDDEPESDKLLRGRVCHAAFQLLVPLFLMFSVLVAPGDVTSAPSFAVFDTGKSHVGVDVPWFSSKNYVYHDPLPAHWIMQWRHVRRNSLHLNTHSLNKV